MEVVSQATPTEPIRIDVTGSRIARVDAAAALPVQVIDRAELRRGGWTTAAEVLAHVAANFNGANAALGLGETENPGLASANLRGLGDGNTLVLLNGRRVPNFALLSDAVDLNAIPAAAIDRVEILKDGASAIYGADAIAGVVNFITRRDFRGIELDAQAGITQRGGGNHLQASMTLGAGDLAVDRFNAFATIDWQKDQALSARDRAFAATGVRPELGLQRLGTATFPANIRTPDGSLLNPAYAGGCAPPASLRLPDDASPACGFDVTSETDLVPASERWSVLARTTWQAAPGHALFAELLYARNKSTLRIAPTPAFRDDAMDLAAFSYPADGPFYPVAFAATHGLSGPLELAYRTVPLGRRSSVIDADVLRFAAGAEGTIAEWRYATAYTHGTSNADIALRSGYVSSSRLAQALQTGLIDPFATPDAAGSALLASTQITGRIRSAQSTLEQVDGQLARDLAALPGGPLALAIGGEWRRERLEDRPEPPLADGDILGTPSEVSRLRVSRSVFAAFAEIAAPIANELTLGAAARYDNASDFGHTTNPKVTVRWQPARSLLLRASWGTGFRAPSLPDLHAPRFGSSVSGYSDPLRCPVTNAPFDCGFGEYSVQTGDNPDLRPERSKQATAGFVWQPASGITLGIEAWRIDKKDMIESLDTEEIFEHFDVYGTSNVVRGPVDPAYPDLPGPIRTLIQWNQNLGSLRTSGIDVALSARSAELSAGRFEFALDGTYVREFTTRFDGLPPVANAGRYGPFDAVPRWRHYASFAWQRGPWSASIAQTFQSGYVDANPTPQAESRRVGSYALWDAQAVYTGFPDTSIAVGVKNLLDRDPPFSNQTDAQQSGYDPAYADPRGRMFYLRISHRFR